MKRQHLIRECNDKNIRANVFSEIEWNECISKKSCFKELSARYQGCSEAFESKPVSSEMHIFNLYQKIYPQIPSMLFCIGIITWCQLHLAPCRCNRTFSPNPKSSFTAWQHLSTCKRLLRLGENIFLLLIPLFNLFYFIFSIWHYHLMIAVIM